MKVAFRADASAEIGAGHLMRCLTLAEALRKKGAECLFITRKHPGSLVELIHRHRFALAVHPECSTDDIKNDIKGSDVADPLPAHAAWLGCDWKRDAAETRAIIESFRPDWLVVDHYALDARWEREQRAVSQSIMVIDDLADRMHDCDLLLDMTLGRRADEYLPRVPAGCTLMLGPEYSLLRTQFEECREHSLRRRKQNADVRRVLVSMGGSDPMNATDFVLRCIEQSNIGAEVDVVLGKHAPHVDHIRERIASMTTAVTLHCQVENMAEIMSRADLAIGAGGTTSWERCCLGLPAIVLTTEANQGDISRALHESGAIINLGRFEDVAEAQLIRAIRHLVLDGATRNRISERAARICDGKGVGRVLGGMLNDR